MLLKLLFEIKFWVFSFRFFLFRKILQHPQIFINRGKWKVENIISTFHFCNNLLSYFAITRFWSALKTNNAIYALPAGKTIPKLRNTEFSTFHFHNFNFVAKIICFCYLFLYKKSIPPLKFEFTLSL